MSDIVTIEQPARRQLAPQPASKPLKVTPKVRAAIEAMVWQGLKRAEAAQSAGLKEHSLYVALRSPHVKQHYLSELEVLRTSERARNFHTLCDVRDQTGNQMARVNAVKAMEQLADDPQSSSTASRSPGVLIVVGDKASVSVMAHDRSIEPKPLIQHTSGRDDEGADP